ncbi:MAG: glycosyl hydrolase, partial [Bacteroidota bacterium]
QPFQLNMPVTPITDMLQKHDDLIIATAGRGFWILDDVGLLRQYQTKEDKTVLYQPEDAVYGQWGSPLNGNSERFDGMGTFEGINPANGVVFYYRLPKVADSVHIQLEIKDANGKTVRTLTSKGDPDYQSYDGGPPRSPKLSKKKGLNRFVWDTRYPIMTGAPRVYIEGSFRGHKAAPGKYSATLTVGDTKLNTNFSILKNPTFKITDTDYKEYHKFMSEVEANLNQMHNLVNQILDARKQLESVVGDMEDEDLKELKKEAKALIDKMKKWDEEMIQRKSKAYDDVENFPNMFTAEYIYMINQTQSSIPRVNQPNKDRRAELDKQWKALKATADEILKIDLPAMNKKLWENGIGAVRFE